MSCINVSKNSTGARGDSDEFMFLMLARRMPTSSTFDINVISWLFSTASTISSTDANSKTLQSSCKRGLSVSLFFVFMGLLNGDEDSNVNDEEDDNADNDASEDAAAATADGDENDDKGDGTIDDDFNAAIAGGGAAIATVDDGELDDNDDDDANVAAAVGATAGGGDEDSPANCSTEAEGAAVITTAIDFPALLFFVGSERLDAGSLLRFTLVETCGICCVTAISGLLRISIFCETGAVTAKLCPVCLKSESTSVLGSLFETEVKGTEVIGVGSKTKEGDEEEETVLEVITARLAGGELFSSRSVVKLGFGTPEKNCV